jgi:hypothetical protein
MIVVKIELWPKGFESKKRELGRLHIINDASSDTLNKGNYKVNLLRKNTLKTLREGYVTDYPRKSYNVWRLVLRSLRSVFPEE